MIILCHLRSLTALPPSAERLLWALHDLRTNKRGWPSYEEIQRALGWSKGTISYWARWLERTGLVSQERRTSRSLRPIVVFGRVQGKLMVYQLCKTAEGAMRTRGQKPKLRIDEPDGPEGQPFEEAARLHQTRVVSDYFTTPARVAGFFDYLHANGGLGDDED